MVRWKVDAIRVALMSLGVLVGGVLLVIGATNLILRARGEPAPSWGAILAVVALGAALCGVPVAIAARDLVRRA